MWGAYVSVYESVCVWGACVSVYESACVCVVVHV